MKYSLAQVNLIFDNFLHYTLNSVTRKVNHGSVREFLWTVLPAIILVIIAIPSVKLLYLMDIPVYNNGYLPICTFKVIGHQWYWSYEHLQLLKCESSGTFEFDSYMLDEETVLNMGGFRLLEVDNPLYVPVNTTLRFLITSVDVLHSWAVPSLGVKVDAIPGRLSQVFVNIKRTGEFYGQCSEICGVNHGFMPIKVIGVKSIWFDN